LRGIIQKNSYYNFQETSIIDAFSTKNNFKAGLFFRHRCTFREKINLTIKPAPVNHGIKFVRTDLPDKPGVSAHFNMVVDTSLATVIGYDGFIVSTIEHLMAGFAGFSIDNAIVELFVVKEPIELEEDGKFVGVYPASKFRITCTIYYDHPLIREQSYSIDMSDQVFEKEICRARTFGFLQEIEYLKKYGFARGGSLDNVIVLDEKGILNKDGLRFPDEFVRHKILDSIGDFSLLGIPVLGHVILNKSGHSFNHAFLKKFFENKKSWETRIIHDINELPQL